MECPKCGGETSVRDGHLNSDNTYRRRRHCLKCGFKFSTKEVNINYLDDLNIQIDNYKLEKNILQKEIKGLNKDLIIIKTKNRVTFEKPKRRCSV